MTNVCNNTSVGILVEREGKTLLIERGNQPFGFALPAGHVDEGETYEQAAVRELKEEVGLEAPRVELIAEGRKENACRREGGSWHYWKLYRVPLTGELKRSHEETKQVGWYTREDIRRLAEKTEVYRRGEVGEAEWERDPGLEPVMYDWFVELKLM